MLCSREVFVTNGKEGDETVMGHDLVEVREMSDNRQQKVQRSLS